MISHQEAEVLTSARQDAPLDPLVERELQAHLATCDQCRAFAAATERLTAGLRGLPTVAANPRVKREVMSRVRAGRNPFASVLGGFGSSFQPGPALAAVALVALIGLFGWIAMDRLFFENGSDGNNQIAAVPTEMVTREAPNPTATLPVAPTATTAAVPTATTAAVPTATTATTAPEPTATTPAQPTATTAPVPTAITAPEPTTTTAPVPTATTAAVPTATVAPAPTATTAPQPTETEAASAARTTGEGPVDLTTAADVTAEPTETPVPPTETPVLPTETVVPPTETVVPPTETPVPTATEVPPTETPVPTATDVPPTETPQPTETPAPIPSPTPGIEPLEGSTSVPVEQGDAAAETGIGSADQNAVVPTAPVEPEQTVEVTSSETPPATEIAGDGTGGTEEPVGIELIDPNGETTAVETAPTATADAVATTESTTEAAAGPTETVEAESSTESLADVSERYQGIVGDPSEQLGLTRDGRLEFMSVPDGASMTTSGGYRLQSADVQPGVVTLCDESSCEPGMDAPEAPEGWQGDVPMGTVDGTVYILRLYADRSEVYAASADGSQLVDVSLVGELGPTAPPAAVYESGGVMYAWLPSGQWLEMSGNSAQALSGSYTNPTNVRFAPSANGGPLIGYFSGGMLVVAPVGSPDAAILTLPADGVDFDIAPAGDRVAVIQGNSIVIYDIQGNQLTVYDGGGMQPGSLIWLRSGIVWVDRNDGALYQIPETAP